jgi:hypothetical protein
LCRVDSGRDGALLANSILQPNRTRSGVITAPKSVNLLISEKSRGDWQEFG